MTAELADLESLFYGVFGSAESPLVSVKDVGTGCHHSSALFLLVVKHEGQAKAQVRGRAQGEEFDASFGECECVVSMACARETHNHFHQPTSRVVTVVLGRDLVHF